MSCSESFVGKRYFLKSHEWVKFIDAETVEVGISDHAQQALGDLVFVNLPEVGDSLTAGEVCADVESVKAVSDIYSPVTAKVTEVNSALLDAPEKINEDAWGAWFFRANMVADHGDLLDEDAYNAMLAEEE